MELRRFANATGAVESNKHLNGLPKFLNIGDNRVAECYCFRFARMDGVRPIVYICCKLVVSVNMEQTWVPFVKFFPSQIGVPVQPESYHAQKYNLAS